MRSVVVFLAGPAFRRILAGLSAAGHQEEGTQQLHEGSPGSVVVSWLCN